MSSLHRPGTRLPRIDGIGLDHASSPSLIILSFPSLALWSDQGASSIVGAFGVIVSLSFSLFPSITRRSCSDPGQSDLDCTMTRCPWLERIPRSHAAGAGRERSPRNQDETGAPSDDHDRSPGTIASRSHRRPDLRVPGGVWLGDGTFQIRTVWSPPRRGYRSARKGSV
jgi:hypothetical protein